jgi:hypothetical protein
MSMPICGVDRTISRRSLHGMRFMHGSERFMDCMQSIMHKMHSMHGTHSMHGMRSMHGKQTLDATEIATRMMNNGDEDGDGALSTDELVKLIERKDTIGAGFHKNSPVDEEKTDAISETESISDTEPVDGISEPQSIINLVEQLLSRLDLSEEETENFIETMKDYGINMTA